jgi:hypothetical protein
MAVAGATMVVLGFFLPWLDGTAEFAARDFSGFDLARLVRNFEIVASPPRRQARQADRSCPLRYASAGHHGVVLALVPTVRRKAAAIALGSGAVYALVILTTVAALSAISWTDLEGVLGAPMSGFFVSVAGGVALAASALLTLARAQTRNQPARNK